MLFRDQRLIGMGRDYDVDDHVNGLTVGVTRGFIIASELFVCVWECES